MKCEYCGSDITVNDKFCPNCGAPNSQYLKENVEDSPVNNEDYFDFKDEEMDYSAERNAQMAMNDEHIDETKGDFSKWKQGKKRSALALFFSVVCAPVGLILSLIWKKKYSDYPKLAKDFSTAIGISVFICAAEIIGLLSDKI